MGPSLKWNHTKLYHLDETHSNVRNVILLLFIRLKVLVNDSLYQIPISYMHHTSYLHCFRNNDISAPQTLRCHKSLKISRENELRVYLTGIRFLSTRIFTQKTLFYWPPYPISFFRAERLLNELKTFPCNPKLICKGNAVCIVLCYQGTKILAFYFTNATISVRNRIQSNYFINGATVHLFLLNLPSLGFNGRGTIC